MKLFVLSLYVLNHVTGKSEHDFAVAEYPDAKAAVDAGYATLFARFNGAEWYRHDVIARAVEDLVAEAIV